MGDPILSLLLQLLIDATCLGKSWRWLAGIGAPLGAFALHAVFLRAGLRTQFRLATVFWVALITTAVGLARHRALFDHFNGPKREYTGERYRQEEVP